MMKSRKTGVFFLSAVYLALLTAVIFPHHHHEEFVCYTSIHCETDDHPVGNAVEGLDDHHHDHNTSEESEKCISADYYILTAPGKNLKESVIVVENYITGDYYLSASFKNDFTADFNYCYSIPFLQSHYTAYLKQNIPLRAPPTFLV